MLAIKGYWIDNDCIHELHSQHNVKNLKITMKIYVHKRLDVTDCFNLSILFIFRLECIMLLWYDFTVSICTHMEVWIADLHDMMFNIYALLSGIILIIWIIFLVNFHPLGCWLCQASIKAYYSHGEFQKYWIILKNREFRLF